MSKTLYIVKDIIDHEDTFDLRVTFDKTEATEAARAGYQHLTERERKTHHIYIESYGIDVPQEDPRSAADLYNDLLDEDDEALYNPTTAEEYLPEWSDADLEDVALTLEAEGRTTDDDIDLTRFQRPDRRRLTAEDRERIMARLDYHTNFRTKPRKTNDSPIAQARIAKGWTQARLAEAIGCKPSQIANWETGIRLPKLQSIQKIAEALEVDWKTLIEE